MAAVYATDARLLELYPELQVYDVAVRLVWLAVAEGIVYAETFGNSLDVAHAAMTGHLLETHPESKGTGADLQSMSLGPATATFGSGNEVPGEDLTTTKYGRHYKILLRSRVATVVGVSA